MTGVVLRLARDPERGTVIGFSLSRRVEEEAELLLIAVSPGQHRQGVGSCLLDDFLRDAQANGVQRVHLEVRDGNPAALMYRAAGFAPIGRRRNYYRGSSGDRFDAVTYARSV
jgi:ribosomal-protein-alanine N-acetyltransferase